MGQWHLRKMKMNEMKHLVDETDSITHYIKNPTSCPCKEYGDDTSTLKQFLPLVKYSFSLACMDIVFENNVRTYDPYNPFIIYIRY